MDWGISKHQPNMVQVLHKSGTGLETRPQETELMCAWATLREPSFSTSNSKRMQYLSDATRDFYDLSKHNVEVS